MLCVELRYIVAVPTCTCHVLYQLIVLIISFPSSHFPNPLPFPPPLPFPSPAPTPNVSLSSTTVRLPSVSPYNTLTLTCTATLPVPRDMLTASLSFTWLKGSDDVTSSSSSSDPLTSTLTRQETTPSTFTYTCRYSVVVSGDTPYTADTSATVTVTGEIHVLTTLNVYADIDNGINTCYKT